MELEKKKSRPTKRAFVGPIIRYHSVSMPVIQEIDDIRVESKMDVDETVEGEGSTLGNTKR